jgi:hypothetical protein
MRFAIDAEGQPRNHDNPFGSEVGSQSSGDPSSIGRWTTGADEGDRPGLNLERAEHPKAHGRHGNVAQQFRIPGITVDDEFEATGLVRPPEGLGVEQSTSTDHGTDTSRIDPTLLHELPRCCMPCGGEAPEAIAEAAQSPGTHPLNPRPGTVRHHLILI